MRHLLHKKVPAFTQHIAHSLQEPFDEIQTKKSLDSSESYCGSSKPTPPQCITGYWLVLGAIRPEQDIELIHLNTRS